MNIPQQICKVSDRLTEPNSIIVFFTVSLFCILLFLIHQIVKRNKSRMRRIILSTGTTVSFFILWVILSVIILIFGGGDNPPSADYHALHAMIKLRCYIDNDKTYCPKTAKDVYEIAPDYLKGTLRKAQITYQWQSKIKTYTLIVRNNLYHYNNDRVAIFDPRLIQAKSYGLHGIDFFDADIANNCNGTYRITNPPPFDGPWQRIN